jgi:hypothetical protein
MADKFLADSKEYAALMKVEISRQKQTGKLVDLGTKELLIDLISCQAEAASREEKSLPQNIGFNEYIIDS